MPEPIEKPEGVELGKEDPFDLGDTSNPLLTKSATPASERPRNPDGTFAPAAPVVETPPLIEPAQTASKHPGWLVEQAASFAISDEEMAEMSTGTLNRVVNRHLMQQNHFRSEIAKERTLLDQQVRQPEPARPPEPVDDDLGLGER
jgi:hypothetical protein